MQESAGTAANGIAGLRNPFLHETVADPWQDAEGDVEEINGEPFRLLLKLIEQVRTGRRSTSILIHGPAGAGKTHLMSRLRAHIEREELGSAPPRQYFISVRLDAAPTRLWRHILRSLAGDLLRPRKDYLSRLDVLLDTALQTDGIEAVSERLGLSRSLALVLGTYHARRHRAVCGAWLRGEQLGDADMQAVGLPVVHEDDVDLEDRAKQIVVQISALAAPAAVVFCFDQVEALQAHKQGLGVFGAAVSTLHSRLSNALLVMNIQSTFAREMDAVIARHDQDRMREHEAVLHPLDIAQGRRLLHQRISLVPEIERMRPPAAGRFWPVSEREIEKLFDREGGRCAARKLIHRAKELFEQARGGAPADAASEFLRDHFANAEASHSLGDLDDDILQGLAVAGSILGFGQASAQTGAGVDQRIGDALFAVCNQSSYILWRKFRLLIDKLPKDEWKKLRLVRDARLPIGPGAHQTRNYLADLEAGGARLVLLSPQTIGALGALRRLDVEALAQGSVRDWIRHHAPEALDQLLGDLLRGPGREPDIAVPLWRYLEENPIAAVEEIAGATGLSAELILSHARTHSTELGLLAGPPALVYRAAARAAAAGAS